MIRIVRACHGDGRVLEAGKVYDLNPVSEKTLVSLGRAVIEKSMPIEDEPIEDEPIEDEPIEDEPKNKKQKGDK